MTQVTPFFYRLLDSKMNPLYDNFRRCYADILYRWGLLKSRVLVSLNVFISEFKTTRISFVLRSWNIYPFRRIRTVESIL